MSPGFSNIVYVGRQVSYGVDSPKDVVPFIIPLVSSCLPDLFLGTQVDAFVVHVTILLDNVLVEIRVNERDPISPDRLSFEMTG